MKPGEAESGTSELPHGLTYLGFDYGLRRIGVAVGQTVTGTATDLVTLERIGSEPNWSGISKLIDTWRPDALIVGLPLNGYGEDTDMSRRAREFGKQLSARHGLAVHWVNEHLTSAAARDSRLPVADGVRNPKRSGKRGSGVAQQNKPGKQNIDQVAARLILQSFLNDNATL